MGATAALSLASTIDNGTYETPKRVGVFSYGSGCCSEFFSGVVRKEGQDRLRALSIKQRLDKRYELSMEQYDHLLEKSRELKFGTRNMIPDKEFVPQARTTLQQPVLFLKQIKEFHREYEWAA
jgi:polyketide biosynthesis 3-hydroxy-3-methylglutaryl-CoA synthase-like enzyme PksG